MAQFEAKITDEGGVPRVTLAGECDLAVAGQLSDALLSAVHRAPLVVVDLAGLGFLDSSGVHSLIAAHHAARERDGRLVVVNAVGAVATVLDLTGVGPLLSPAPNGAGPGPGRSHRTQLLDGGRTQLLDGGPAPLLDGDPAPLLDGDRGENAGQS